MKRYLLNFLAVATLGLMSCQEVLKDKENSVSVEQFNSDQSIKDYLSNNVASTGFNGKPYCAYEVLDASQQGKNINIYSWVVCQEYYLDKQNLRQGTGSVLPVALVVQRNGNNFSVVSHRVPRDGAFYGEDMPVIFSKKFRIKTQLETTEAQNERVNRLQDEIKRDAGVG